MHATIRRYEGVDPQRTVELTKKVNDSYMAFKAKYDRWAGYSEAVYHDRIRG